MRRGGNLGMEIGIAGSAYNSCKMVLVIRGAVIPIISEHGLFCSVNVVGDTIPVDGSFAYHAK